MKVLFKNARIYDEGVMKTCDMLLSDASLSVFDGSDTTGISIFENVAILPGFCDVHVHFREPGFSYKETIKTGSKAGAHGGYTSVCTMPNLNPVPHNAENIGKQLDIISKDAVIKVYPYGSITVDQKGQALADFEGLRDLAIAYSDDGRGVQSEEMMRQAMLKAKSLNKMIVAHCEVDSLLYGGYIHDGLYSALNNEKGIFSRSEWEQIARDIKLAKETGCAYHVCHISTKESVAIIRQAKKEGVNITCETAPHYLVLNDMDIQNEGRFKMNPPIRDESDRLALVEGILDGTIDMIATDHAPHSAEEKAQGLRDSKMGVVGLESAFSIMYTEFVKTGKITMERLLDLMCYNPKKRFGIDDGNSYTVFDLSKEYKINPEEFLSKGRATPFDGRTTFGKCLLTVCDGKVAYKV